ncbi:MAG TPA: formate--tetrahydrofolate ligase [Acidobacteriaceae bacterium]|nr:formate--tetrahydrofolate ligase [Acidobacteriaceae bacterium]
MTTLAEKPVAHRLLPIPAIARKLGLADSDYEPLASWAAKLHLDILQDSARPPHGKLILVTATTPTTSGEGKTVTSIGLVQGLERIGKRAVITSREPSLGPVFGMKGGAAGGGLSRIEPSQKINLHFTGDLHAITSAHNLLAALIDAHLFHGNDLDIDPDQIWWPRAMDMNDRALRRIAVDIDGKRQGAARHTGFVITAASEIMAILALARDRADLRRRLNAIVIGASRSGKPVTAADLSATGAMMALLADAILPNLVQTTEGAPALVHAGPFGNIAHGTSSVISQLMGLRLADYVVNECGFAADLGAEKYLDIVTLVTGVSPSAAVLVTTVQSLRNQGQNESRDEEGALVRGSANLARHIQNLRRFGVPTVVAINRFPHDTPEELDQLRAFCDQQGVASALTEPFTRGGAGSEALARSVVDLIEKSGPVAVQPTYALSDTYEEKLNKVATQIYGADGVLLSDAAREKLQRIVDWGYTGLPICIAKTQYSFSDDPKKTGAPTGWTLRINDVSLSAGAGFIVPIAGNMMLMPGLPKVGRAEEIDTDEQGEITGV